MIFMILISIFICAIGSFSQPDRCIDPDEHFLNKKLTDLVSSSLWYHQHEMKYKKSIFLQREELDANHSNGSWKDFECDTQKGNATSDEQKAICPRRYNVIFRRNKYPFYTKQVMCTCEKCGISNYLNLQKNLYKCMPVWKEVPVLTRENCQKDGFYYWSPGYEWINIGCTCGTTFKLISYRST